MGGSDSAGHSDAVQPDQHGFVLLGERSVHGAHLAMFHMPQHQFQVVIRLTLGKDGKGQDARQKYLDARSNSPTTPFIVVNPETHKMLLPEMLRQRSFPAEIWGLPDNDFNRKEVITTGLTVAVDQIVCKRRFAPGDAYPDKPRYLVFGTEDRAHMTHYLTRDPDYQLIVDLENPPAGLAASRLIDGVLVELRDVPEDHRPGSDPLARYRGRELDAVEVVDGKTLPDGTTATVKIGATRWFDVKYLNMPPETEEASLKHLTEAAR